MRGYTTWKAFIERRAGQRNHQQEENESSLKEGKHSGGDGFSLAEL